MKSIPAACSHIENKIRIIFLLGVEFTESHTLFFFCLKPQKVSHENNKIVQTTCPNTVY